MSTQVQTPIAPIPFKCKMPDDSIEVVTVKELDVYDLYQFVKYGDSGDSFALVSLVTGKPIEVLRKIDRQTWIKLVNKCIELNFTGAMDLMADPIAQVSLVPWLAKLVKTREILIQNGGTTKPSVDVPAPLESAVATGTVS